MRSIIRAVRRGNYTLLRLEMHANGLTEPDDGSDMSPSEEEEVAKGSPASWQECENELKRILTRNSTLKYHVEKEALALLRYARPLLVRPKSRKTSHGFTPCSASCACAEASPETLFSSIGQPYALPLPPSNGSDAPSFPFMKLPTELQLHILSFLAPTLSTAQRLRIFAYASSPATLPTLLPCLSGGSGCIPDPASPQFAPSSGPLGLGLGGGIVLRKRTGASAGAGSAVSACANGTCMGAGNSVLCRREAERSTWLAEVQCTAFELE